MKKFILPICFALSLAACSDKKDETQALTRQIVLTDTANLTPNSINTDVAAEAPVAVAAPRPTVVYVDRYIKPTATPRVKAATPKPTPVQEQPVEVNSPSTAPSVGTSAPTTPDVVVAAPEPVVNKKKGISDAGKGAVIGAVGGAVAGAVIGKNGKGAAIGAVIGAAGGYVIGRKKDKQSGRIE